MKTKNERPGHYTQHATRKYQCNGKVAWSTLFRRAAAGGQEGDGIRAALAYAAGHAEGFLGWAKAHPADWQRAPSTPGNGRAVKAPGKPARRAAPGKATKGARKAKPKRAPEQLPLAEVK